MDKQLKAAIHKLGVGPYKPGSSATRGYLYNPLPFPGCGNIPCHRPNSEERWKLIEASISFKNKAVLDVGCATGYFSFKAVQRGASSVVGLDADVTAIDVCNAAARAFNVSGVSFRHGGYYAPAGSYFDIAFVLSILNWMGRERAIDWLTWASKHIKVVFIEIPLAGDGRGGAKWLRSDAQTEAWLSEFFGSVTLLGTSRAPHRGKLRSLFKCQS